MQSMGIVDPAHRVMIMACVDELVRGESKMMDGNFTSRAAECSTHKMSPSEQMDMLPVDAQPNEKTQVVKSHRFKVKSFSQPVWCDSCRKYLWGVVRQGLQCIDCGYNTHKMCLDLVSQCQPDKWAVQRLRELPPGAKNGGLFGAPLASQIKSGEQVPRVVKEAVEALNQQLNTPHLYVHQPPPGTLKLLREEAWSSARVDFSKHSPLTVAAFVKRYFDELPDGLVPPEMYFKFINAAALATEAAQVKELDSAVEQMPQANQSSLSFLLAHLARLVLV